MSGKVGSFINPPLEWGAEKTPQGGCRRGKPFLFKNMQVSENAY